MADESAMSQHRMSEQVNSLLQLCTRLDTNLTGISKDFNSVQIKLEELARSYSGLRTDIEIIKRERSDGDDAIEVLEARAESLKDDIHRIDMTLNTIKILTESSSDKWSKVIDMCFKVVIAVISGYLLYVFGIDGNIK
jgi:chromosome segregation ATPase